MITFEVINPQINTPIRNSAYFFWKKVWEPVLKELDNLDKLNADEFLDSKNIGVIHDRGSVIALHVYKHYDVFDSISLERKGVSPYKKQAFENLKAKGVKEFINLEWMCVCPKHRKSSGQDWSKILLGCSMEYLKSSDAQAATGVTYNKRRVNEIAYYYGAENLSENSKAHGVDVSFVVFYKQKLLEAKESEIFNKITSLTKTFNTIDVAEEVDLVA